jgi:hypothetical protein
VGEQAIPVDGVWGFWQGLVGILEVGYKCGVRCGAKLGGLGIAYLAEQVDLGFASSRSSGTRFP